MINGEKFACRTGVFGLVLECDEDRDGGGQRRANPEIVPESDRRASAGVAPTDPSGRSPIGGLGATAAAMANPAAIPTSQRPKASGVLSAFLRRCNRVLI